MVKANGKMNDKELFQMVFDYFKSKYPHRNLSIGNLYGNGLIVSVDGEPTFNTDGFNALYNIKRLCDALSDELR